MGKTHFTAQWCRDKELAASAGLVMKASLASELSSSIALVLLVAMSTSSDPDSSAPSNDVNEGSHYDSNNQWDNSSMKLPSGWLETEYHCPSYRLLEDIFSQYTSVPRFLFTVARHNACQNLSRDMQTLQNVHLPDLSGFLPRWLVDAATAGECPWLLERREFFHSTLPPAILEVKCLCDGHRCSSIGDFKCVSVKREVMVWSTEFTDGSYYQPRILEVTAACVCAQRRAPLATRVLIKEYK